MARKVLVVGGGAAGIMAAITAARAGAEVHVYEKTDRIGTKILISGGGKCNITHAGPMDSLLRAFRRNEATFLRGPFYRFRNEHILEMLTNRGLKIYTREDGRIFPEEGTAKDVVRILQTYLQESGARLHMNAPVEGIESAAGQVSAIIVGGERIRGDSVILSVGGASYPKSGTTGDGYVWAKQLGHTIVPVVAALAPIETLVDGPRIKPGVSLRNVILRAKLNGKELDRFRGDLLFTHRGVSGPAVLEVSRAIAERWQDGTHTLEVDLLPGLSFDQVLAEAQGFKANYPNQYLRSMVDNVPSAVVPAIFTEVGIDPTLKNQAISKKQVNKFAQIVKGWNIGSVIEVLFDKGEVVAGGVSLDEVDPSTMESRVLPGLYLAGEILDVAGRVGGYNLQAAWSTGYVAGNSAAQTLAD